MPSCSHAVRRSVRPTFFSTYFLAFDNQTRAHDLEENLARVEEAVVILGEVEGHLAAAHQQSNAPLVARLEQGPFQRNT